MVIFYVYGLLRLYREITKNDSSIKFRGIYFAKYYGGGGGGKRMAAGEKK